MSQRLMQAHTTREQGPDSRGNFLGLQGWFKHSGPSLAAIWVFRGLLRGLRFMVGVGGTGWGSAA